MKRVFEGASPLGSKVSNNFSLFNFSAVQARSNFVPANRNEDRTASQELTTDRDLGLDGLARVERIGPIRLKLTGKAAQTEKLDESSKSEN